MPPVPRLLVPLAAILVGGASPLLASVTYEFTSSSVLTSNFVQNGPGSATPMTVNTSVAGVGGANGVLQATNNDVTIVTDYSFDLNATTSFSMSVMIQYRGVDAANGRQYGQIGVLGASNQSFNGFASGNNPNYISFRLQNSASTLQLLGQSAIGGSTANTGLVTVTTPTLNNWVLLSGTFTKIGSNQISFSASVTDYGATGTTPGSVLGSTSGTFTVAAGFYTDTTVFSGLRSTISSSQGYLDNLTVVPEAEWTAVATTLALGWLLVIRARRRRVA